jgi:hypothetical protein
VRKFARFKHLEAVFSPSQVNRHCRVFFINTFIHSLCTTKAVDPDLRIFLSDPDPGSISAKIRGLRNNTVLKHSANGPCLYVFRNIVGKVTVLGRICVVLAFVAVLLMGPIYWKIPSPPPPLGGREISAEVIRGKKYKKVKRKRGKM